MLIDFEIRDEVFDVYPDLKISFVIVTDEDGEYSISEQKEMNQNIINSVKETFINEDVLTSHRYNNLYKEFYKKMGFKSKKIKKITTPIRQALRVLKSGKYKSVNRVIDYCMLIEYTSLISFQVYDLEKVVSPIRYMFANGSETLISFSGDIRTCKKGELILLDKTGVLHSVYYGNNKEKSVNDETFRYLIRIMFIPGIKVTSYYHAVNKVILRFRKHKLINLSKNCNSNVLELNNI